MSDHGMDHDYDDYSNYGSDYVPDVEDDYYHEQNAEESSAGTPGTDSMHLNMPRQDDNGNYDDYYYQPDPQGMSVDEDYAYDEDDYDQHYDHDSEEDSFVQNWDDVIEDSYDDYDHNGVDDEFDMGMPGNETEIDTDGDMEADESDYDDDGDGIYDEDDADHPDNAAYADADKDGFHDGAYGADYDTDNNGIVDDFDHGMHPNEKDDDGDGINNEGDKDRDGDGINDPCDVDYCPSLKTEQECKQGNNPGWCDWDGTTCNSNIDLDGDGVTNPCDGDDDGDGIPDYGDYDSEENVYRDDPGSNDDDGDGWINEDDDDQDGDGKLDEEEYELEQWNSCDKLDNEDACKKEGNCHWGMLQPDGDYFCFSDTLQVYVEEAEEDVNPDDEVDIKLDEQFDIPPSKCGDNYTPGECYNAGECCWHDGNPEHDLTCENHDDEKHRGMEEPVQHHPHKCYLSQEIVEMEEEYEEEEYEEDHFHGIPMCLKYCFMDHCDDVTGKCDCEAIDACATLDNPTGAMCGMHTLIELQKMKKDDSSWCKDNSRRRVLSQFTVPEEVISKDLKRRLQQPPSCFGTCDAHLSCEEKRHCFYKLDKSSCSASDMKLIHNFLDRDCEPGAPQCLVACTNKMHSMSCDKFKEVCEEELYGDDTTKACHGEVQGNLQNWLENNCISKPTHHQVDEMDKLMCQNVGEESCLHNPRCTWRQAGTCAGHGGCSHLWREPCMEDTVCVWTPDAIPNEPPKSTKGACLFSHARKEGITNRRRLATENSNFFHVLYLDALHYLHKIVPPRVERDIPVHSDVHKRLLMKVIGEEPELMFDQKEKDDIDFEEPLVYGSIEVDFIYEEFDYEK